MRPAPNQFNKVFRVPLSAKNRRANVVEWARIRSACAASVFEDGREDERDNQPRQTLRTLRRPKEKVRLFVFLRDLEDRPPRIANNIYSFASHNRQRHAARGDVLLVRWDAQRLVLTGGRGWWRQSEFG